MPPEPPVNILLVDDRPENLLALEAVLGGLEQNLVRAGSGREALKRLLERDFALILLDVQMPDANGFDVLARMRQHPVLKNMPVVMLTAEATRESVLRGLQGGADGYITKPFVPDVLVTAVKAVLGLLPPPEPKNKN